MQQTRDRRVVTAALLLPAFLPPTSSPRDDCRTIRDLGRPGDLIHLWADRLNVMMATVHTQSEAQDGSLARLAVNNGVIARRFCGGQFDFKERDAVGLDAAHPHSGTTKVKLVHVEERVHPYLPRA